MKASLPSFFAFKSAVDLVRIGRDYDGGYLVSQTDIEKSEVLIGLGLYDDWSFESDFVAINDVDVYAYDASLDFNFWIKRVIIESVKNPFGFYAIKKFLSYKKFFKGKHKHIKKFVGLNSYCQNYLTLTSVLRMIKKDNIFLKIDVEGAEYRFLDDLISNQNRISGLVIELHDCDIHLKKIKEFIRSFDLNLIHIHANNHSPIKLEDGLPVVIELTFSKFSELSNSNNLPNILDMPCNKNEGEIQLIVSN